MTGNARQAKHLAWEAAGGFTRLPGPPCGGRARLRGPTPLVYPGLGASAKALPGQFRVVSLRRGEVLPNTEWFRRVMSRYPSGVTVVTGRDPAGRAVGFTASAVSSVSLHPPLVLVCADRDSASLPVLVEDGRFAVSFLRAEHVELARRFSADLPGERFHELSVMDTPAGLPVLEGALAWTGCRLWKCVDAGDHVILIGEVVDHGLGADGSPLVFFGSAYGTFADLPKD